MAGLKCSRAPPPVSHVHEQVGHGGGHVEVLLVVDAVQLLAHLQSSKVLVHLYGARGMCYGLAVAGGGGRVGNGGRGRRAGGALGRCEVLRDASFGARGARSVSPAPQAPQTHGAVCPDPLPTATRLPHLCGALLAVRQHHGHKVRHLRGQSLQAGALQS